MDSGRAGRGVTRSYGVLVAAVALMALTCPVAPVESEITRDQAIEIASQEISFDPESTDAVLTTSDEREVWRVTFRGRLPGQPPGLFESAVVEIDATNGEIVSIART